jgi:rubrerythrin
MKTPEDEAFDELAQRQGMWGGGFNAKRQAAMDKVNSHFDEAYKKMHEDCAMYGTSWSKNGERIDPMSVYKEPVQEPAFECKTCGKLMQMPADDCLACERAQPEQEPVAWVNTDNLQGLTLGFYGHVEIYIDESIGRIPLYTTPPAAQPVQEPETFERWNAKQHGDPEEIGFLQALRIAYCAGQNSVTTPPLPAQEPVACERCKQLEEQAYDLLGQLKVANLKWSVAHPWVGLTDEEIELIIEDCDYVALDVAPAIEQALKEKNNGA